jgi:hypothetical protein
MGRLAVAVWVLFGAMVPNSFSMCQEEIRSHKGKHYR